MGPLAGPTCSPSTLMSPTLGPWMTRVLTYVPLVRGDINPESGLDLSAGLETGKSL